MNINKTYHHLLHDTKLVYDKYIQCKDMRRQQQHTTIGQQRHFQTMQSGYHNEDLG